MLHSKNKIQFLYPLIDRFKDLLHASNAGIQKYTAGSSTDRSAGQCTLPEFQHNKEDDGALAPNKLTDVVPPGYEWLSHSSSPKHPQDTNTDAQNLPIKRVALQKCKFRARTLKTVPSIIVGEVLKSALLARLSRLPAGGLNGVGNIYRDATRSTNQTNVRTNPEIKPKTQHQLLN